MPIYNKSHHKILSFYIISIFFLIQPIVASGACAGKYWNYLMFLQNMEKENVSVSTFIEKVREDSLGSVWRVRMNEEIFNPIGKKEIEVLVMKKSYCYTPIKVSSGETWFLILERKSYSKYWVVPGLENATRSIPEKNLEEFVCRKRIAEAFAEAKKSKRVKEIIAYYPDGKIWAKGRYNKGLIDGEWSYFSRDEEGKLTSVQNYENGMASGLYLYYGASGKIIQKSSYTNNKSTSFVRYNDSTGKIEAQGISFPDGNEIVNKFNEKDLLIESSNRYSKESGKEDLSSYTYYDYYPNGILKERKYYHKKESKVERFTEDGKLIE